METALPVARPRTEVEHRHGLLTATTTAAVALTTIAALLGAGSATRNSIADAALRGAMVGAPMAVGLYALRFPLQRRFGWVLLLAGAVTFVTTLSESGDPLLHSVGRVAGWADEVAIAAVLLTCPIGRLPGRRDRQLLAGVALAVATFYLPTLLLSDHFRVPSPWGSCLSDCPRNAFFVLPEEPPYVDALRGAGSIIVFALMVAVVVRLRQRLAVATAGERRLLAPLVGVGIARSTLLGLGIVTRDVITLDGRPLEVVAWLLALCIPALALAFLVGLLRSQLFSERAVHRLAQVVERRPDAPTLQRALADVIEDPTTRLAFPKGRGDRWVGLTGEELDLAETAADPALHEVRGSDDEIIAAIVHTHADPPDPDLLATITGLAAVAIENQRLADRVEEATLEVHRSRQRLVTAADRERRKIERNIHDGAQQKLVALRIELGLLGELARRDVGRFDARLEELQALAEEALEELRVLAHGMCPPLLADRGIVEALRAAAARATLPVELKVHHVGRYSPERESAVYFCVLEALQNVEKHAGARRVTIDVDGRGRELRFSVHDDGRGADPGELERGQGITNIIDRLAALGGGVRIASAPGLGTTIRGRLPLPRGG